MRLQFSGGAESAGHIILALTPDQGEPLQVTVDIAKGRSENAVARTCATDSGAGRRALQASRSTTGKTSW
jgi:hypothetical protein